MNEKLDPSRHTFAIIKPLAVERGQTEEIINRILAEGLQVWDRFDHKLTRSQAEQLYEEHRGKEFFDRLIDGITVGPCVFLILRGENAAERWRKKLGDKFMPGEREPGTIRGDLMLPDDSPSDNCGHGARGPDVPRELLLYELFKNTCACSAK